MALVNMRSDKTTMHIRVIMFLKAFDIKVIKESVKERVY